MKTLVWLTHSFRTDSRLTTKLEGPCTFVYYSPYYFAGEREKQILKHCSKQNLEAFYESLDMMKKSLRAIGHDLYVFKQTNPIEHINSLIDTYGFTKVIIDLPLFGMWKSTDPMEIKVPFELVDSDLIDDECPRMTAKSRWMAHTRNLENIKFHKWNPAILPHSINEVTDTYPQYNRNSLIMPHVAKYRAIAMAPKYGETRDKHNGQTRLSTAFQNGTVDPHNMFYQIVKEFQIIGADFSVNEGAHASMLRQFAFREISIIQSRRTGLTMEDNSIDWAKAIITEKSYENLVTKTNTESTLTFEQIRNANTGDELVDQILSESYKIGVMPNRARMFYAGWLFYNAPTGIEALQWLINTFDLLLLDGQCPTNYMQSCSTMNLQYGKVMLLNRNRVQELLQYEAQPQFS
jgi:deoxyribodipyrimidine photolyase